MTATVLDFEVVLDLELDFDHALVCELPGCLDGPGAATHMLRIDPPCGCRWVALLCKSCADEYRAELTSVEHDWECISSARHPFPAPLSQWSTLEPLT